jgi:hypothetical protein
VAVAHYGNRYEVRIVADHEDSPVA